MSKKPSAAKRKALVKIWLELPLSRRLELMWEARTRVRPEEVARHRKEAEKFFARVERRKGGAMPPKRKRKTKSQRKARPFTKEQERRVKLIHEACLSVLHAESLVRAREIARRMRANDLTEQLVPARYNTSTAHHGRSTGSGFSFL